METKRLRLRAPEPYDIDILFKWENDVALWREGLTIAPYSRQAIENYVMNYDPDIFATRQLRLMIELKDNCRQIGTIDLYDFDPINRRTMIGYLIDRDFRGSGYASEAIDAVAGYCSERLGLHQLGAVVAVDNLSSRRSLEKSSFKTAGRLRSWLARGGHYVDALIYQRML